MEYRYKINGAELNKTNRPIFVVQEHHATHLHWDLRLQIDGVLKSWAVPKGIPMEPKVRRLAIQTEDHSLEYAEFEGIIPEGQYGAGLVKIWDKGEYEPEKINKNKIVFRAYGNKMNGRYALIKMRGKNWILMKTTKQ